MNRRALKKLEKLAGIFEIPEDIVFDLPRLSLIGNRKMLAANHKGIIEYSPRLIRIKVNHGEVIVEGDSLTLANLQAEEILVEGIIKKVEYGV